MNIDNNIYYEILDIIKDKNNHYIAIASHDNPDGDAIGSMLALEQLLIKLGRQVDVLLQSKIPLKYKDVIGSKYINKITEPGEKYDVIFLLDCSDLNRTYPELTLYGNRLITIDHHDGANSIGNLYLNLLLPSTGIIIYNLIKDVGTFEIDNYMATLLYMTLRYDTNQYRNNLTGILTHRLAARFIELGANINLVNNTLNRITLSNLELMGVTLRNVVYDSNYKLTYLFVSENDIKFANATAEDAANLIDYVRYVNDTEVAVLFIELNYKLYIKVRSVNLDVNEILIKYGGGGHKNAAGAVLSLVNEPLKFVEEIIDYFKYVIHKNFNN